MWEAGTSFGATKKPSPSVFRTHIEAKQILTLKRCPDGPTKEIALVFYSSEVTWSQPCAKDRQLPSQRKVPRSSGHVGVSPISWASILQQGKTLMLLSPNRPHGSLNKPLSGDFVTMNSHVVATHSRKQTHSEGQCRCGMQYYTGGPKEESPLS